MPAVIDMAQVQSILNRSRRATRSIMREEARQKKAKEEKKRKAERMEQREEERKRTTLQEETTDKNTCDEPLQAQEYIAGMEQRVTVRVAKRYW